MTQPTQKTKPGLQMTLPTKKESSKKATPKEELVSLGISVLSDIKKGTNPKIELSVRGLSNVTFDKEAKTLVLGSKTAQRYFFNVAHAKKFRSEEHTSE